MLILTFGLLAGCDQFASPATPTPQAVTRQPTGAALASPQTEGTPAAQATASPTLQPPPDGLSPTATLAVEPSAASPTPALTIPANLPAGAGFVQSGLAGIELAAIAAAPAGEVFYAAGPGGVWRSTDFGVSWTKTAAGFAAAALALDPRDPQIVYAATPSDCRESGSLYASTDGGASWSAILAGARAPVFPAAGTLLVTSCAGTQLSSDRGATWRVVDPPPAGAYISGQAIAVAEGGRVYAAYRLQDGSIELRASADGGDSWRDVPGPEAAEAPPAAGAGLMLAATSADARLLFLATDSTWYTADEGQSWNQVGETAAGWPTALLAGPRGSAGRQSLYLVVEDQGVFRTSDASAWTTLVLDDLPVRGLAHVASTFAGDTLTPPILLAATPDGVWRLSLATIR